MNDSTYVNVVSKSADVIGQRVDVLIQRIVRTDRDGHPALERSPDRRTTTAFERECECPEICQVDHDN